MNRELWTDLDAMNCESYKNDVILGNVQTKSFSISEGEVTKTIETIFIARRVVPEFGGMEMHDSITMRGQCGAFVEIETLFNDHDKVYTHTIAKGSVALARMTIEDIQAQKLTG